MTKREILRSTIPGHIFAPLPFFGRPQWMKDWLDSRLMHQLNASLGIATYDHANNLLSMH